MAAPDPVLLRIGSQTVPAATPSFAPALEAANQAARIPGLPDTLNPGIIDPAKATAFVQALPQQPAATLARLAGHELSLTVSGLGLSAAAPTRAEAFAAPFSLTIDDIQGKNVLAHTSVAPDPALAKTRAAEAKSAFEAADTAVAAAERAHASEETGVARRRRAAAASAWRLNATAWAKSAPADRAAQDAQAAAQEAARTHARPSGALPG